MTDEDENLDEKPQGRKKAPAVTKAIRRKRSLSENEVTTRKRTRGRPNKQAEAGDNAGSDGEPVTADDGDGASQVDDGPKITRRSSQRLSENVSVA